MPKTLKAAPDRARPQEELDDAAISAWLASECSANACGSSRSCAKWNTAYAIDAGR